ncbi:MAG: hypothetical protein U1E78_02320 [Gammaproteobacteria bacterium]
MSDNDEVLFIFVKGHKGRGGFVITNANCEFIFEDTVENLVDDKGLPLWPVHTDWKTINSSLEYVKNNKGSGNLPSDPTVCVFTSYENAYHILSGQKDINESKKFEVYFNETQDLIKDLHRTKITNKTDDNIKFLWIPEGFVNRMPEVVKLLNNSKNKLKPN